MSIETRLQSYTVEKLIRLSPTHPDRVAIEEMAQAVGSNLILPIERLPLVLKPTTAELDLYELWLEQTQRYIDLGFHTELSLTKKEYLDSLPEFGPQPEEYIGRLDVPLLVEPRIPWERQAELAGIDVTEYLRSRIEETGGWEGNHSKTPDVPYTDWFNSWGQRFTKPIRPFDARAQLAPDESGAGLFEGIALQVHHPEITSSGKYFDLIGDSAGSGRVPFLRHWDGRPRLDAYWGGRARPSFRPLVRGTKIVTK